MDGVAEGRGTWTDSGYGFRIEGEWAGDAPRGRCVRYAPSGFKAFEGEWAGWWDMRGKRYADKGGAAGVAGELRGGVWCPLAQG